MGSGGMVVMDEDNCMVDVAKFFLSFTQSESCGKCPTCRIGTYQMLQILEKITSGRGEEGDIERLQRLGELTADGSLCGLGQSAPNPVLTTIRYFRDEYEEHVKDKYCRAKVCSGMGILEINQVECVECGLCKQVCAFDAIVETKFKYFIARDYCTRCKACYYACPVNAIKLLSPKYIRLEEEFKLPLESLDMIERRSKMTLGNIIQSKPLIIITVHEDQRISEAIRLMGEKNVSGVFVMSKDNKLAGLFTERDIVRCVEKGISLEDEVIGNIARTDPITFDPSMALSSAISIALRKNIRHLPIIEEDKIVGMITFRDLISYLLPEILYISK
jgi:NADH-quinone oxidoreductase subunit F/NADP-reducing hydrogenase subunit HndC